MQYFLNTEQINIGPGVISYVPMLFEKGTIILRQRF